jgi:D-alanine-D-alanine ligase
MADKIRIAVLFGGRSSEHDVSIMSGTNVLRALDTARYDIVPIYITREGVWRLSRFDGDSPETPSAGTQLSLVPGGCGRMLAMTDDGAVEEWAAVDIVFPVLHGLNGEDGSVQGLAQAARVPFVGCGILGSATALDKDIAKKLLLQADLPVARSVTIREGDVPSFEALERELGLPVFVKPVRQGSSVGVSKVATEDEYADALSEGFRHDRKLLAEEFVKGREIELAVLEDEKGGLFVSRPGEIAPAGHHAFYSYDAKYIDADGAAIMVPAELSTATEETLRGLAADAFRALGCDGMARVDFFVTAGGRVVVNELNTIPGFTNISMYPKVMAESGIDYPALIDRLVAHGLARGV